MAFSLCGEEMEKSTIRAMLPRASTHILPWVILTETDVVREEVQEALALFLPVAACVARAPGCYAGGGVVNVVWSDGAACGKGGEVLPQSWESKGGDNVISLLLSYVALVSLSHAPM